MPWVQSSLDAIAAGDRARARVSVKYSRLGWDPDFNVVPRGAWMAVKTMTDSVPSLARFFGAVLCAAVLVGCATSAPDGDAEAQAAIDETNDPIEPVNRAIFSFNQFADGLLIKPLALMYRDLTPPLAIPLPQFIARTCPIGVGE